MGVGSHLALLQFLTAFFSPYSTQDSGVNLVAFCPPPKT
jgi:hypothetical protein